MKFPIVIVAAVMAFVNVSQSFNFVTLNRFLCDYFNAKHIKTITMFTCSKIDERVHIVETFSSQNMRLSIPNKKTSLSQRKVEKILKIDSGRVGIIYDTSCFDLQLPVTQKATYFNSSYVWLLFHRYDFNESFHFVKKLPLSMVTDAVMADLKPDSTEIYLYDLYHTGFWNGGQFMYEFICEWTTETPLVDTNNQWTSFHRRSMVQRRPSLEGITLRTVTFMERNKKKLDIHSYLMDEEFPHEDTPFKMNYQLVRILRDMFNFTIKFVLANNWSDRNSKGFYRSGNLLGLFADGKGDLLAGSLLLREDRVEIADVLYMTYPLRCGFIFRYLGDFDSTQNTFYAPFDKYVWYCFLGIIFLVTIIAWIILLFENKYLDRIDRVKLYWSDTVLFVIGACCQMGMEMFPTTSASRIVCFIFFFSCLVIYNFYTSSIVSSLLNIKIHKFSVIDLADSSLKCGSIDVGYVHNLLFDIPMYPNMGYFNARKKTKDFYFTIEDGVEKVKKGGFAYHAEFNSMYRTIENNLDVTEICELQEVDTIARNMMGILAMKNSPYTEMFRAGLTRMDETGHLNRQSLKWISKKPACQANMIFKEVDFKQIMSSHYLLLMGVGAAAILIIFECKAKSFKVRIKNVE